MQREIVRALGGDPTDAAEVERLAPLMVITTGTGVVTPAGLVNVPPSV